MKFSIVTKDKQVNGWIFWAKQGAGERVKRVCQKLGRGRECLGVEGAVSSPVRFTKWYIFKDAVKLSATNIKLKKPQIHFIIKNIFDKNEFKTPIGCLTFVFCQKCFLWQNELKADLFWCGDLQKYSRSWKVWSSQRK